MKKPSALFNDEHKALIADAIDSAETHTSGEILPVVVTTSGRYDRAEDILGLCLALLALAIAWLLFQGPSVAGWSGAEEMQLGLGAIIGIVVAGFVVGAALATLFPMLRLPFIPKREMQEEVERRALEMFQRLRVRATENATGVLIYVSLYEHMVRVVGDDAINEKFSPEDWQEVCGLVVEGMKAKTPELGLANGIRRCGELLAKHLPIQPGDRNELASELVLIDD